MFWKKNKKQTTNKTWDDITLKEFQAIEEIVNDDKPAKEQRIKRLLYGEQGGDIEFLNNKPEPNQYRKGYELNGTYYKLEADMTKFNLSQMIDYQQGKTLQDWLSVVLVPCRVYEKCHYNDGSYDLQQVKEDVLDIKIKDAMGVANFLKRQSQACFLLMIDFLQKQAKQMETMKEGLSEEQKASLIQQTTDFSTLLSQFVKDLD